MNESHAILPCSRASRSCAARGYDVVASTPEEFATRIKVEIETHGRIIRAAKIKPD